MPSTLTTRARLGLGSATAGCLLVGAYGLALVASGFRLLGDDIAANDLLLAVRIHIATASAALVLLAWQLWPGMRSRRPRLHRWTGRAYVVAAVAGGASGVAAAVGTSSGPVAAAGFACLGVLWTGSTAAAYLAARRRAFASHQRWAIRSFALAFAAVTLRLYLPVAALAGIEFHTAYVAIAWLSWVPNLLLAERALRRPATHRRTPPVPGPARSPRTTAPAS
jgi:uncharacterized membrane protein